MENNYSVYEHICPNGKRYIGITSQKPERRWGKNGIGYKAHNQHFYNAILKYGWVNIAHNIIASGLSEEEACKMERVLVALYNTCNREFGYNKSTGGEAPGTGVHKTLSEDARRKISEKQKGRKIDPESIRKRVEARKGYRHSKATKEKMSEAAKVPIVQIDLNGNLICKFDSILTAANKTNVAKQNICKCCKCIRKTAGGYIWKYYEEKRFDG